jgi:PTS system nitrogen regulatory IIA component
MNNDSDIMTLGELASYLKLAKKTILRLVHRRELPSFKVASQWRFKRSLIDEWIMTRIQDIPSSDLNKLVQHDRVSVPLSRLLKEEFIILDVAPGTKEEILRQLVRPFAEQNIILDEEAFLEKLLQREEMVSTAIGRKVALPHIRNPRENPQGGPYLVLAVCKEGTDFGSLDGEATHLFFLLSAGSEVVHLRLMAKITLLLRKKNVIQGLLAATEARRVISLILEQERKMELGPKYDEED